MKTETEPKRYVVFVEKRGENGVVLVRAGDAFRNADGSLTINLDMLPLDGKLVMKEAKS